MTIELKARQGVSLVEVLVAMTLMAVVLSGLGGMAFAAARSTTMLSADTYRQGVLQEESNRMVSWPFDQLAGQAGCRTITAGRFPHQRCVAVQNMGWNYQRVTVIVAPTQPGVRADTVVIERTRPPVANVLSTS